MYFSLTYLHECLFITILVVIVCICEAACGEYALVDSLVDSKYSRTPRLLYNDDLTTMKMSLKGLLMLVVVFLIILINISRKLFKLFKTSAISGDLDMVFFDIALARFWQ